MLVLARREKETIVIGDNVRVTVVAIKRGSVKLAIEAPEDVSINRLEIHRAIQAASKQAQQSIGE